jgi:outer membrane protein OmpA-like peptidoglycan-associated protein
VDGLLGRTVRLRGTLRAKSRQPQTFPLLYNGARVAVPTLTLTGQFTGDGRTESVELKVVADRRHPLIVQSVTGKDVWQIVRIEMPERSPAKSLETALARDCRAELSGIYFDFASAELDDRSQGMLAAIAQVLTKNLTWSVILEGHTDGVGSDAANLKLSAARVNAVRDHLTRRHGVPASRIEVVGFGESRPREPNTTFEGRARNRRVELVRKCSGEQ